MVEEIILSSNDSFPLVHLKSITFPERPDSDTEDKVLFFNPRSLESFDDASMRSLLDSILEDGLQQPPIIRKINGVLQAVAGERRIRCLLKAYEENLLIFDEKSQSKRPAKEVLEYIPCHLHEDCDDEKALRLAFTENAKHKSLSPKEDIVLAERLSKIYDKQEDICRVLGTNPTWVSQTLAFREKLPKNVFKDLEDGLVARNVAVQLLSYREEDRDKIYEEMKKEEQRQREENFDDIEMEFETAEVEEELAEEEDDEVKAQRIRAKAIKRRVKAQEKLEKAKQDEGKLDQGHFDVATTNLSVAPRTPKMMNKISLKKLISSIDNLIEENAIDDVHQQQYPLELLRLMKITSEAIHCGNQNVKLILRNYMIEEGLWNPEESYSEEIYDESEI